MQSFLQYRRVARATQARRNNFGTDSGKNYQSDVSRQQLSVVERSKSSSQSSIPTLHGDVEKEAGSESARTSITGENTIIPSNQDGNNSVEPVIVKWDGPDDPLNPKNWSMRLRVGCLIQYALLTCVLLAASSIDSTVIPQAAKDFGVSEVAESLATAMFLIGMGLGCLIAAPFSETFGRNPVYVISVFISMIWIMASGLAPNLGAQIIFRFLAGCAASTPLVCTGGSIADLFSREEKTWCYPLLATFAFAGPMFGPVISAYIGTSSLSWRWVEWTMLIAFGMILAMLFFFLPETYTPVLLQWKAEQLRKITGDKRYLCEFELSGATLLGRLKVSMIRPFQMLTEPIVIFMTVYLTVVYIVLFTFLVGWPIIFEHTYGLSQGLSNMIFVSMIVGNYFNFLLLIPIYILSQRYFKNQGDEPFKPEIRLWWGTFGASIALPISLFWLAWTNYSHISIWSAICAVALFGYSLCGIFVCAYMYVIDSYEIYAASALAFLTLTRYVVAGGMTVVGIPFYENVGTHWTLTILAIISSLLVPVIYAFQYYGPQIRAKSKYAIC